MLAVPDQDGRRRLAKRIVGEGLSVRAAERAARWAGARTKERRVSAVDPALAARVKDAFRLLTGFEAKVGAAGLQVPVDGDVQLEELAEALERLRHTVERGSVALRDGRSWIRTRDLRLIRAAL